MVGTCVTATTRGRRRVRWAVAGREHCKSFATKALADAFLTTLKNAAREGQPFDPATGQPRQDAAANDRSLVLYAREGRMGVLLTGDLEADGVTQLLADPPPGPVSLLKLPHHGSSHSLPGRLVARFRPVAAFASAGFGNSYRLPAAKVVNALCARGIPLYRTDLDGTVRFRTRGGSWEASGWGQGLFRWQHYPSLRA